MSQIDSGQLTNEQLALLTNLMYIDTNQKLDINGEKMVTGISEKDNVNKTLGEYLKKVKIDHLPEDVTNISHEDWKNIINAVENDEKLRNLTIKSTLKDEKEASAICVVDDDNNATAVFRGTGTYEWLDNGTGGYLADTDQQKKALDWINSLPYDDITATGHSKGGNKSEYANIVSDKVTRSVSFDGPGFSEEFCDKYKDKIAEQKDTMTLISSQAAYVSTFYFNIAGNIVYLKSDETTADKLSEMNIDKQFFEDLINKKIPEELVNAGIRAGREHMANSTFTIKDGKVQFNGVTKQDPVMKLLHQYVEYYTKNASKEDKKYFFALAMNQMQKEKLVDGVPQKVDIGSPPSGFNERLLKLSLEWIETLNLTKEQKEKLKSAILKVATGKGDVAEINSLLSDIANQASETTLPSLQNDIRDFSMEAKERLIALINDVEGDNPLDFKGWAQWDELDLSIKAKLEFRGINRYCSYIRAYYSELVEKNNSSIEKINKIFEKEYEIDNEYSSKLKEQCEKSKYIEVTIRTLKERFKTGSIDVDLSALKAK